MLATGDCFAQNTVTIASWNLENFGSSKSDEMIKIIANTLKDFDLVAIQEVVAGPGGAQAVGRLGDALNRTGSKWEYTISDPTTHEKSNTTERYAFLWKAGRISRVGHPALEKKYQSVIEREPFLCTFLFKGKQFTIASMHAVPKSKQPEQEIKYLKYLPEEYPDQNIIFLGDFNCPQSHNVFVPLKGAGYQPALMKQKTTLRQKCKDNECLASEFDNIFFRPAKVHRTRAGIIRVDEGFADPKAARKLSDHLPVYMSFSL